MPSAPKDFCHRTDCPGTTSFEGTAFTWRSSGSHSGRIASNSTVIIAFPSCPVSTTGFVIGSEDLSNKAPILGNRPTFLPLTRWEFTSANFIPAANDHPVEWRTCRPDQTSRLAEPAFKFRTCIAEAVHFPNSRPDHQLLLRRIPDQKRGFRLASSPLPEIQTFSNCPVYSVGVHHFLAVRFRKILFRKTVFPRRARFQKPASLPKIGRAHV